MMHAPDSPDISYFDTDFGARIGLMICFDIMFGYPVAGLINNDVDAVAFPTAWYDEVPFLTGKTFKEVLDTFA